MLLQVSRCQRHHPLAVITQQRIGRSGTLMHCLQRRQSVGKTKNKTSYQGSKQKSRLFKRSFCWLSGTQRVKIKLRKRPSQKSRKEEMGPFWRQGPNHTSSHLQSLSSVTVISNYGLLPCKRTNCLLFLGDFRHVCKAIFLHSLIYWQVYLKFIGNIAIANNNTVQSNRNTPLHA
jgi:hypothetical protein